MVEYSVHLVTQFTLISFFVLVSLLKYYWDQKKFYLFLGFQNYVTEPLSNWSFTPSFENDTCLFDWNFSS